MISTQYQELRLVLLMSMRDPFKRRESKILPVSALKVVPLHGFLNYFSETYLILKQLCLKLRLKRSK